MSNKEVQDKETKITLTKELILAYDLNQPVQTLELITATRQFLETHFKGKDKNGGIKKPLTYTQLRNVLLEVKKHPDNIATVIPTLAYMEAKLEDWNQKDLVRFIRDLAESAVIQRKEGIFLKYMDMLVAFHRYYSSQKIRS